MSGFAVAFFATGALIGGVRALLVKDALERVYALAVMVVCLLLSLVFTVGQML